MSVMTRSIVINAPVGEVFEFARDPSRFVAAIPGFTTQLAVLTSDGVGSLTHATVHELGMHFAGTVEYIEVAPRGEYRGEGVLSGRAADVGSHLRAAR